MSDDETIEFKDKGLMAIMKAIGGKMPEAKVGILGEKNSRGKGANGNAAIGKRHEFGDENLPMRSFLRMPITTKLSKYIQDSGGLSEEVLAKIIDTKSMVEFVKKLGVLSESIVADAFQTGGFGDWKPSVMTYKKNQQTLVETQQLRNSITSEVEE